MGHKNSKTNLTRTLEWLVFAACCLWIAYAFTGCASLPKPDRPITLYKGCPEFKGICKKTKSEVKKETKQALSNFSAQDVSDWVEQNIDDQTRVRILPAESKLFGEFISMHVSDYGVILKYINDLKRRVSNK